MIIDNLMITLGLDPKGVASGMKKAENTLQSGVKNIVSNILAPLAGAFAFKSMIEGYISAASSVGKLSESIGVNIEDMQAWGEAAKRSGGSAEAFYGTMSSLSDKMAEFAFGGGSAAPILAQLGISARKSNGEIKGSLDIMKDLASASERYDSKTFKGIAKKLGIDDGTIKLLQQGSSAVETLVLKQKALGVYTKEDASIAAQASNALADLVQVFKAVGAWAMRVVVPALTFITEKAVTLITFLKTHKSFLIAVFAGVAAAITGFLIPSILKLTAAVLTNPMTWIFLGIAAVVLLVAGLIDDLYTYINGGDSALAGFWSKFGSGKEIAEKLSKVWEKVKDIFSSVLSVLEFLWPAFAGGATVFAAMKTGIGIFTGLATAVKGVGLAFKVLKAVLMANPVTAILMVLAMIAGLIIANWDTVKSWFTGFWAILTGGFEAAANKIKDIWASVKKWISDKISAVIDILPNFVKEKLGLSVTSDNEESDEEKPIEPIIPTDTGAKIKPSEAIPPSVINNSKASNVTNDSQINVGAVNIQTQATDAKGIASEIPSALQKSFNRDLVMAANTGVVQK